MIMILHYMGTGIDTCYIYKNTINGRLYWMLLDIIYTTEYLIQQLHWKLAKAPPEMLYIDEATGILSSEHNRASLTVTKQNVHQCNNMNSPSHWWPLPRRRRCQMTQIQNSTKQPTVLTAQTFQRTVALQRHFPHTACLRKTRHWGVIIYLPEVFET